MRWWLKVHLLLVCLVLTFEKKKKFQGKRVQKKEERRWSLSGTSEQLNQWCFLPFCSLSLFRCHFFFSVEFEKPRERKRERETRRERQRETFTLQVTISVVLKCVIWITGRIKTRIGERGSKKRRKRERELIHCVIPSWTRLFWFFRPDNEDVLSWNRYSRA